MTPEQKARQDIDQLLTKAGWAIQDVDEINLGAGLGVAVREYPEVYRVRRHKRDACRPRNVRSSRDGSDDGSLQYLSARSCNVRRL